MAPLVSVFTPFLLLVVFFAAAIEASAQVTISLFPASANVVVTRGQSFTATVIGSSSTAMWAVDGISGGNSSVGTISMTSTNSAKYMAPATAGSHTVSATVGSVTANAKVVVFSGVGVDFGSRATTSKVIPSNVIAAQQGDLVNPAGLSLLQTAQYAQLRTDAKLQTIFVNGPSSPQFQSLDDNIDLLKTFNIRPLLVVGYTPPFLQNTTYCNNNYHSVPTNISQWAQLAAQLVDHLETRYPGWVKYYEIWNEPNLASGLCLPPGADSVATYISMYDAAVPLMRAQTSNKIFVGGPALASGGFNTAATWISKLFGDATAKANLDFVSYHQYSTTNISGLSWDNAATTRPLLAYEQDPQNGIAARFVTMSQLVKQALAPNPPNTPIFITEFNDSPLFQQDCCRNNFQYSPMFNALAVIDLLNTVYSGAQKVPGKLAYFSSSTPIGKFCLVGRIDTNMDCAIDNTLFQGYPQYFAYQLIGSSAYLGLQKGGHMAVSVAPAVAGAGLAVTAFYNATQNAILIVNPGNLTYNNFAVTVKNPGSVSNQGTLYTLKLSSTHPSTIQSLQVNFSPVTGGLVTQITVPPYSTLGLVMKTL